MANPVNFAIMPLFALANTNIRFEEGMAGGLLSNMGMGIMIGLFLGKPVGITLMTLIVVKLRLGKLPKGASWKHIVGLGLLGGIGFTMSIFIALLSFDSPVVQAESKFAVLVTSTVSGIAVFFVLRLINRKRKGNARLPQMT